MAEGRFVCYYRVSTDRQGRSRLGLDAQREAVEAYLNGNGWEIVAEYTEIESGSKDNRPELSKALKACRLHDATLVFAKFDRLSRDAHFLLGLQKAGVKFVAVDMPDANELTVGIMAIMAQHERRMISDRTKAALAAAKARGVKLRSPDNLTNEARAKGRRRAIEARRTMAAERARDRLEAIQELQADGIGTLMALADALNTRGVPTPSRRGRWQATTVRRVLDKAIVD
ncbi:MAG: recombinase family protein [bacterium]|nr:recombinase family protein [bacterium]